MIDFIHKKMTQLAGFLAKKRMPWINRPFIHWFIRHYGVNMKDALLSNISDYPTFNAFFTRALSEGIRPIDMGNTIITSPADGVLSQSGAIDQGRLIQAKGRDYTVKALLADHEEALLFDQGYFCTIYLSPKDYHRVHMPFEGTCYKTMYVPGRLLSVSLDTANQCDQLFAKNERVITYFNTPLGKMAVVFVGATIVASIELAWQGVINPAHDQGACVTWTYEDQKPIILKKGQEMGRFKLGSTIIVLLENPGNGTWQPVHIPPASVLYGQPLVENIAMHA